MKNIEHSLYSRLRPLLPRHNLFQAFGARTFNYKRELDPSLPHHESFSKEYDSMHPRMITIMENVRMVGSIHVDAMESLKNMLQ